MLRRKAIFSLAAALVVAAILAPGAALAQETRDLSLMDALKIALENNLDLVSARYSPELAEQDIEIQESNFDLGLQATASHDFIKQTPTQFFAVPTSESDTVTAVVQQNLKFGGNYSIGLAATQREQSDGFDSFTSYGTNMSLDFSLPLLKGFGVEDTTEQLILSRSALEVSLLELEGRAESVMEQVEGAYWDMVAARENLKISRISLKRAQDQLALNRKKVEVGTLAPIEITQAEAEVASQEESVIMAETGLEDAEDQLLSLMGIPEADPLWDQTLMPLDQPEFREVQVDLEAALDRAMESRPDIHSARQSVKDRELGERLAHRRTRHQLDLSGGYAPSGASFEPDGLSDSISALAELDEYSWNAQLTYRVPIGNRQARASYAKARISSQQADAELRGLEQTIRVEVRSAARAVESGVKRVQAAKVNTVLQQKKLEAEQKKFENGMSTSFEVLTFQRDLANAELAEVRALLDYVKSLAALEKAKGTLLEARGLSL